MFVVAKDVVEAVDGVDEFEDDDMSKRFCGFLHSESINGKSTMIFLSPVLTLAL